MTPGKFLRLIWPDAGFYCIAHPFEPGKTPTIHRVFGSVSEAVTHAHELTHTTDVFFAVLSLAQDKVWDPDKTDYKTGTKGAWATRTQGNMLAARALFFDLDVGADAGKYPTQQDALNGLRRFLEQTKLPTPTLISSGGGVHVYWHFDQNLPAAEWRTMAWHMRCLATALGLKVDPTRTIDASSVLRVPGTFNWKNKDNPRPVKVLDDQPGVVTPLAHLQKLIQDAMIANGVAITDAPTRAAPPVVDNSGLGSNIVFNDFGPPPTLEELGDACAQVRKIIRSQTDRTDPDYGPLDNTAWYRGMLATIKHVENGDQWCRDLTALHPRTNSDVDDKLQQLEQFGPAKCTSLQQFMPWGDSPCQGCPFRDKVANPFVAARRSTPAPPPMATSSIASSSADPTSSSGQSASSPQPSANGSPPPPPSVTHLMAPNPALLHAAIPNPPYPYERLKTGAIALKRKDKDNNETTVEIYANDLYPLKRLVNRTDTREQQVWRVTLPRTGHHDFTIEAEALYDIRKFTATIANNGIYPNKADIPALQDYMVAYISQLQKTLDADVQSNYLGWSADHQQFTLPDKTLLTDGTVKVSSLSLAAERAAQFIRKAGDPNTQRSLLHFYNKPEYRANQFVILCGLASILFDMTGQYGIVVNCSGEPGASKSTTLYTTAGLWGDSVLWPINGTNRGATANARMQRMTTNGNMPTCVDEITHMPDKEVADLVMGVTQPGHRLRLDTAGAEKKSEDTYKSAIMITTANSSLHSVLSRDNSAGTAGSMRVFEIRFVAQGVHTKAEADEFLRQIKQHYGHIGELFTHFVVKNREMVAKRVHKVMERVDTEARIKSSERYWSAVIAAAYVAAEISEALGLLPYSAEDVLSWAIHQQIPYMRGVVKDEYRDPLAILTDYIAEKHGSIVVIDKAPSIGANTSGAAVVADTAFAVNSPHGALLGHYDLKGGVLLLLKQGFKDHCNRIGVSSSRIIDELHQSGNRVIVDRAIRRTLGAGTNLAKGQAWCFAVDMTHPEIKGVTPVLAASGGAPTAPAAGNLQVVK